MQEAVSLFALPKYSRNSTSLKLELIEISVALKKTTAYASALLCPG